MTKAPLEEKPASVELPFVASETQPGGPGSQRSGEHEGEQQGEEEVWPFAVQREKVKRNQ